MSDTAPSKRTVASQTGGELSQKFTLISRFGFVQGRRGCVLTSGADGTVWHNLAQFGTFSGGRAPPLGRMSGNVRKDGRFSECALSIKSGERFHFLTLGGAGSQPIPRDDQDNAGPACRFR